MTSNAAAAQPVDLIRASPLFDAQWYLATYYDVAEAGADPAEHYLRHGGFENRNPGPDFNSLFYLSANRDVEQAGMNPLLHYILNGAAEGRPFVEPYRAWLVDYDLPSAADRQAIATHIAQMRHKPLLSVLVPTYNTNPHHLRAMIASVTAQSWPHWELCIADDASTNPEIGETLRHAAAAEPRIRLVFRAENGHISAATNSALALASGEFVCLLDHDDLLHENALYEVAAELEAHPDADLIYSDSDLIDEHGRRFDPYFKSDWDPDLMLGHNMVSHLGCYRRSVMVELGGLRLGYEGSQDYDLALRVADVTTPARIRHIPAILYHWRHVGEARSFSQKWLDQCVANARRAIADHLQRRGVAARIVPAPGHDNFSRIIYGLPADVPTISIAVIARGSAADLMACAAGLLYRADLTPAEILIACADTEVAEAHKVLAMLNLETRVRIILMPSETGPVALRNRALAEMHGEVGVLIDGDLSVMSTDWLREMVSQALRPGVGLVGCAIIEEDGKSFSLGLVPDARNDLLDLSRRDIGASGVKRLTREVSALSLSCVAFRRAHVLAAGPLDAGDPERDTAVELGRRLRAAGLRLIHAPFAEVRRAARQATAVPAWSQPGPPATRHHGEDPFYNPNLDLDALFEHPAFPSRRVPPWSAILQQQQIRLGQAERAAVLLAGLSPAARIIEVGGSYSPIAPRSEGWNTTTIDHASRADLVEKYRDDSNVSTDRIEEVDFVWTSGDIADAVDPALHGSFDALVASHVIEHVPNFVGFLASAARLLRQDGTVILAVPDKRYCFDYFRPLTNTAHVLEAHHLRRSRHPARTAYEQYAYCIDNAGLGAWGQSRVAALTFTNDVDFAFKRFNEINENPDADYVDLHVWQFTPSSFELLILELARLGLLDWRVERITAAIGCEFRTSLRRGGMAAAQAMEAKAFNARRMVLLKTMVAELGEQAGFAD